MKRLTSRDEFGNADINGVDMTFMLGLKFDDMVLLTEAFNKLADYEDADVNQWNPCSERLPDKGLRVLMQLNNAWQIVGWYDKEDKQWYALPFSQEVVNNCVLAWMELPQVYRGDD